METTFFRSVLGFIRGQSLLHEGDAVLVCVSGGADSVALLTVLGEISRSGLLPLAITVAHLNHKIRPEAAQDAQFVADLCDSLDLDLISKTVDVPELAAREPSLENVARNARYAFFLEAAQEAGCDKVATGHTRDDNVETVLMHLIRGADVQGLRGIVPKRRLRSRSHVQVVRPLLAVGHKKIVAYLEAKGQSWREDETNRDETLLRNRIRSELLPLLTERYNPGVASALEHVASTCRELSDLLGRRVAQEFNKCVQIKKNELVVFLPHFNSLHRAVRRGLLHCILSQLSSGRQITHAHVEDLMAVFARPTPTRSLRLPGGLSVFKEHEYAHLFTREKTVALKVPEPVLVDLLASEQVLESFGLTLRVSIGPADDETRQRLKRTDYHRTQMFDYDKIKTGRLWMRTRLPGDRFQPLGCPGHKKLKDLFIDRKVPYHLRASIPILALDNEPIWLVGIAVSEKARVDKSTKTVVELSTQRLGRNRHGRK